MRWPVAFLESHVVAASGPPSANSGPRFDPGRGGFRSRGKAVCHSITTLSGAYIPTDKSEGFTALSIKYI